MNIHTHPAITINNVTYQGDFNGKDIGHAICASFKVKPLVCLNDDMSFFLGTDENYANFADLYFEKEDHRDRDIIIAGIFIILVNLGMVWIHKATSKTSTSNEI